MEQDHTTSYYMQSGSHIIYFNNAMYDSAVSICDITVRIADVPVTTPIWAVISGDSLIVAEASVVFLVI